MILKCKDKVELVGLISVTIIVICIIFQCLREMITTANTRFAVLVFLASTPLFILWIINLIMFLRVIELSEHGITIRFLFYSRFYKWSDLKTKRYERLAFRGRIWTTETGVIFSDRVIKKHTGILLRGRPIDPTTIHPFSFVFIFFKPKPIKRDTYHHPDSFAVEESEFRKKMDEWGVEIDEYSMFPKPDETGRSNRGLIRHRHSGEAKPANNTAVVILILGILQSVIILCMGIFFLVNMLTAKPELVAGSKEGLDVGAHGNVHIDSLIDWYARNPSETCYVAKLKEDNTYYGVRISNQHAEKVREIMKHQGSGKVYLDLPGKLDRMDEEEEKDFRDYLVNSGLSESQIRNHAAFLIFDTTVTAGTSLNVTICFSVAAMTILATIYLSVRMIKAGKQESDGLEQ